MFAATLDTCQYAGTDFARRHGASGTKAAGRHTFRISTLVTAAGLAAWFGTGVVHADSARDREACALMDDYAGSMHVGLTPVDYAMRALSKEMPPLDAAHAIADGARNDCPRHIGDLPDGWR